MRMTCSGMGGKHINKISGTCEAAWNWQSQCSQTKQELRLHVGRVSEQGAAKLVGGTELVAAMYFQRA